jgi:hypothetical protein
MEPMLKPFDTAVLVAKLKGRGIEIKIEALDVAEKAGVILVDEVFAWTEQSVKLTQNPYDDFALAVLPPVKSFILAKVDEIDGQKG